MRPLPPDRATLQSLGRNPRIAAFKPVLRYGESNLTDRAYHLRYPGTYFHDLSRHPKIFVPLADGRRSSAAGAYQITWTTWSELVAKYGFETFGVQEQEEACTALLVRCGAADLLLTGDISGAIVAARLTWTSLPGAAENVRKSWDMSAAVAMYHRLLGPSMPSDAQPKPDPAPEPAPVEPVDANPYDEPTEETTPPDTKESIMPFPLALLISTFGPLISNLIPQVAKLVDQSEVAKRNTKAAELVVNTIVEASGKADLPTALEEMQRDPVLKQAVAQAVVSQPEIMGLLEVGGGVKEAREFALHAQVAERPFWFNPVFWITLLFLPLIGWIIGSVLIGGVELRPDAPWWADAFFKLFGLQFTPEVRAGTVGTVLGTVLGGICGIWFGTSYGSLKKDERMRSTDSQPTTK